MLLFIHRINTIEVLKTIPPEYGVEIDVRAFGDRLILHHEPFIEGDALEQYLQHFRHQAIIFNIKEAGIESTVIALAKKYAVKNYFLLDVEFPYLYRASREGVKEIAVRYSEDESIETVLKYKNMVDWVWIDTNTRLPLDRDAVNKLAGFKICLVCPERWGRPEDITAYRKKLDELCCPLDGVMTSMQYVSRWTR